MNNDNMIGNGSKGWNQGMKARRELEHLSDYPYSQSNLQIKVIMVSIESKSPGHTNRTHGVSQSIEYSLRQHGFLGTQYSKAVVQSKPVV